MLFGVWVRAHGRVFDKTIISRVTTKTIAFNNPTTNNHMMNRMESKPFQKSEVCCYSKKETMNEHILIEDILNL